MASRVSNGKRILLVEDEVIVALSQKMEIEKRGYSVITASSGKDAIEAFKSNRSIDLILMDIDLGSGIDGTETAELILQERDIPIVFLSSHTEPEIVEKTEKITSYGYVVKNSSITVLDASIKMAFRLFNEKKRVLEHQQKLKHTNEQLEKSQELILERENKLRESEDRYRSIAENSPIAIVIVNDSFTITFVNDRCCSISGYSREELLGNNFSFFLTEESRHIAIERYKKSQKNEQVERKYEFSFLHKNGSVRHAEVQTAIFKDHTDHIFSLLQIIDITERREVEETLNFQATILDQIQDWITVTDLNGTITYVNNASCNMLGRPKEELIGKNIAVFGEDPEAGLTQQEILQNTLRHGHCHGEVVNYREDGTPVILEFRTHVVTDYNNEPMALCGISSDITERKKSEVTLRKSEERFRSFIENVNDIIYSLTLDGIFTYISPNWLEYVGEPAEDAIGRSFEPYVHPEDISACREFLDLVIRTGEKQRDVKYRVLHRDGSIRWHVSTGAPLFDDDGIVTGYVGVARDMTGEYHIREELRLSEERFKLAVEGTNDGLWDWNLITHEAYHSDQFARMLGYEPEELPFTGEAWSGLLHPDDREAAIQKVEDYLSHQNTNYESSFRMRTKDGSYRWITGRGKCLFDDTGTPIRFVGFNTDITDRVIAEEELKEALQHNTNLLKELQHRAKNSFATIESLITLKMHSVTGSEAKEAIAGIHSRVRALAELYTYLYTTDTPDRVDLGKYCKIVIMSIAGLAEHITIKSRIDSIISDTKTSSTVGMIVNELITNAVKYAFPDNRTGVISIELKRKDTGATLIISDNGVGIPEKYDSSESSGMGLKLVRAMVKQLNGTLDIHSTDGTTITLHLPRIPEM